MRTFFTADHHFGHSNIIRYQARPFMSAGEMDREMIQRWNERVRPGDEVYHLGDFTMAGWEFAQSILAQLNGNIFLVPGDHDEKWIKGMYLDVELKDHPVVILPPLHWLGGIFGIALCHYPLRAWRRSHFGSMHLHGHHHVHASALGSVTPISVSESGPPGPSGKALNVNVEFHGYYPLSLEDVKSYLGGGAG